MKQTIYLFIVIVFSGFIGFSNIKSSSIQSPNKLVELSIQQKKGTLTYKLHWQNKLMVDTSTLSILPNAPVRILQTETRTVDKAWNPVWGQSSEIRDYYNELVITLDINGVIGKLISRVYNQGIGFRFELEDTKQLETATLYCEYNLPNQDDLYCTYGERDPLGPFKIENLKDTKQTVPKMKLPVVIKKSTGKHLSFLESDLYAAKGFKVMSLGFDQLKGTLFSSNTVKVNNSKITTPWRVILIGETAGDLIINTVPLNLATPSKLENTDWIKPGKTLWDWRVHGYTTADGFTYGVNTESYIRFIDFAAEKDIEYFLIDAHWFDKTSKGHFKITDKLDLPKVSNYAHQKGVKLILYYDRHKGNFGDDALFPYFKSLGMNGIKYGFMKENVDFSRKAIQQSAENELLIDFHDSPVPFTGISRTYPNAITREYCHAQQDSRKAFTPEGFLKMALINAIQGPLDMNNGNFDLIGINKGNREKGPKNPNSYLSTVTSEVARTLVIYSGLVCIPDAPEAYEEKADLFEFIQKMPVGKWDETIILNSSIGEYITTARRHGNEWFVGSVIDQKGGVLDIDLKFLKNNQTYEVTFYEDTKDTDCKTNPEAYQIRKSKVKKQDIIKAKLAPGGGHCMWIRPIKD